MALAIVTGCEHAARGVHEELEPDGKRRRTFQQRALLPGRQIGDRLQIQGDSLSERAKHVFTGTTLDRDVEVEADGFPLAILALGVATQASDCQLSALEKGRPAAERHPRNKEI